MKEDKSQCTYRHDDWRSTQSQNYPPEYSVFDEDQTASGATAAILRPISNQWPLFSIR